MFNQFKDTKIIIDRQEVVRWKDVITANVKPEKDTFLFMSSEVNELLWSDAMINPEFSKTKVVNININLGYKCFPRGVRNLVRNRLLREGVTITYINNVNFRAENTVYIFGVNEWSSCLYKEEGNV